MASSENGEFPSTPTRWRFHAIIQLTNRSTSDCTLTGWPEFTLVGFAPLCGTECDKWFKDADHVDIRVPGDPTPVMLRPVPVQPCDGDVGITALGVIA